MRCRIAFRYPAILWVAPRNGEEHVRRSNPACLASLDCFAEFYHRARIRATRWLAMTNDRSLSEPFDQRRRVHLIGLVVAGQGVHHDVDAGAERELALPRFTRRQWQHWLTVGSHRPSAGEIVRRDDDRRHAVAAAGGPRRSLVLARQRFDP